MSKGYKLWDVEKGKVVVSREVTFHELDSAECTDKSKSGDKDDEIIDGESRINFSEEISAKREPDWPPTDVSSKDRVTSHAPPMKSQDSQLNSPEHESLNAQCFSTCF